MANHSIDFHKYLKTDPTFSGKNFVFMLNQIMEKSEASARSNATFKGPCYRSILDSIEQGHCTLEVAFDENQQPCDYRLLSTNLAFERLTGIMDGIGRWTRELGIDQELSWFEIYAQVARTGVAERFEDFSTRLCQSNVAPREEPC